MKLHVTNLQNNQRALQGKLVSVVDKQGKEVMGNSKDISMLDKQNVRKELRRLLVKHGLSVEDIIIKYKEIYGGKLANTKVSDIVKVLENLSKLHGMLTEDEGTSELTIEFASKDTQELADYTQNTLKKTQEVIARIQARRINSK